MAAKVALVHKEQYLGDVTLFDAEPTKALLLIAFPEASSITQCAHCGKWTVDVGDARVPQSAD